MNLSVLPVEQTARTCCAVATARAGRMAELGVRSVLELCVGPSYQVLADAYGARGIRCVGNDVERRYVTADGEWRVGDALAVPLSDVDAVVFAPPLSKGCTGRREDALMVDDVEPRYVDFLARPDLPRVVVLVLPGRATTSRWDRTQTHKLLGQAFARAGSAVLYHADDERGRVTKYHEIWCVQQHADGGRR